MKTFTQIQGLMIAGSMFLVPLNLALRPYLTIFWWNWHLSRFQIHFFQNLQILTHFSWWILVVGLQNYAWELIWKKFDHGCKFRAIFKIAQNQWFSIFFQFLMLDNLLSHHTYSVLMILAEGTTYTYSNDTITFE